MAETATATAIEQRFALLAIGLIQESKTNPRKTFDAQGINELAASIQEQGIVEPLIVRPVEEKDAPYELVAGARRLRAALKAKLAEVPCLIRELTDDAALEIQVIENLQRRDLHPLEEAEGYKALLKRPQYHVEAIAEKTGKSVSYVWQRLKLTELIPDAKKAFLADEITAGHAVQIARLQPVDQKEALEICTIDEWVGDGTDSKNGNFTVSVRDLAQWIRDNIHLSLDGAPWQKDDADLVPKAGACDSCPKRAGNSPGLWPDITRAQTCTDRACFQLKLNAHLALAAEALKKDGKKVFRITEEYNSDEKGVLGTRMYRSAAGKKACSKTAVGFFVDGGKRGKTTEICTDMECRVHKPKNSYSSSGSSSSEEDGKEREQRIIKERATERARHEIFRQVIVKTKSLTRKDLELLALNGNFGLPYVIDGDGWIKDLSDDDNMVAKASDEDLAKYLLGIAIGHQQLSAHGDADILYRAAALRKLDVKAIEKDAARQVTHERMHHAKRQAWKGRAAAGNTRFDEMTCQGCGRTQKDQAKGGWHWVRKNEKNKIALCNDCEHEENERK